MAMRCFSEEWLTLVTPAVGPDYVGGGSCLVDEHERSEVEAQLRRTPDLARDRNIQPVLLNGEDAHFF
ncbi:MAG: hypothetical protein NVS3B5_21880 [Sphingomicrobium sp.]